MQNIFNKVRFLVVITISGILASFSVTAQDSEWTPVVGADTLNAFMSGRSMDRDLIRGGVATAEYFADGTGLLKAGGAEFARTWEIKGDTQICIHALQETACYEFESNSNEADLYRGRNMATGQLIEFRVEEASAVAKASPEDISPKGGAATPSAEEIAAELSNPNTPLGTLNTNFDYITYDGDLAGASDQSAFKITLQPSLPYPLGGGTNFFVRPAIPIIIDQPVPEAGGGFESKGVELGDIGFDASLGFSFKKEAGLNVVIAGMAGTLPTATDDALGLDQWLLGPELGFFMVRKWGVLGIIASHQWDVAGESSFDTSITGGQYIYSFNLKGGWQFFSGPSWSYNHKADSGNAWTLPAGIGLAKTSILKGRPWKFSVQYWNYVKSPDAFGPEHQIRFVVGPVVALPWKGRQ